MEDQDHEAGAERDASSRQNAAKGRLEDALGAYSAFLAYWTAWTRRRLPREDPEVVAAEVRYQALCLLMEFEPDRAVPLDAYLARKLHKRLYNWCRGERRRSSRQVLSSDLPRDEGSGSPQEALERVAPRQGDFASQAVLRVWLEQVLVGASQEERRLVPLLVQGRTVREMAEALGWSVSTTQRLRRKVQERLRRAW